MPSACLNLDDYIHYYRCGMDEGFGEKAPWAAPWYYRYSLALMYCGRLEEALEYAERGALEERTTPGSGSIWASYTRRILAINPVRWMPSSKVKLEPEIMKGS